MPKKIRDIACRVGEYQDNQGQTKGRWQNVGALMKGDDGGEFIILQRWFNPAGVANPDDRESLVLSCFELRDKQGDGQGPPKSQPQAPQGGGDPDDSDIPFAALDWRY